MKFRGKDLFYYGVIVVLASILFMTLLYGPAADASGIRSEAAAEAQTRHTKVFTEVKMMDRDALRDTCGKHNVCIEVRTDTCLIHTAKLDTVHNTKAHQELGVALLGCIGERDAPKIVKHYGGSGEVKEVWFNRVTLKWLKAVCSGAMACVIPKEKVASKIYLAETVSDPVYTEVMVGHEFWHVYGGRHERI